ncbi:branched-chain amino acid ABC transporter permease [Haloferax sp. MBLA0076]|uniref:Branched-chain amino acid ABC transporter permease n=1 Tax=Haloferax litoreum TaxID=2666140 RepID=A0A6A8GE53_9EURY|nr:MULTISPECIES: branched-chain amino acid ABC transporter permease [Haloferax]KAB1192975.1 branched-chain amino acid ABC transporter permease [Haloferax sp. CBA1148]MRX21463.1 branched-chain amino acid ABC transporter permease [Haloferax litoreum]
MSANTRHTLRLEGKRLWVAAAMAVLVVIPWVLPDLQVDLLTRALLIGVLAVAFNLLYGFTGLLSFGHAMFVGAAGYTAALFFLRVVPAYGLGAAFGGVSVLVNFVLALLLGVIAAGLLAVVVGYFSVQLEEIYFAMITLSFSMAIWVIVQYDHLAAVMPLDVVTNGSDGLDFLSQIGTVDVFGVEFYLRHFLHPRPYYYISLLIGTVTVYALWRIVRSPFGTVCQALRENPERAQALGVNVQRHRWKTFVISGAFTGLAGAMLTIHSGGITSGAAHWTASAEPVLVTVIGGPYSFLGPVVGAITFEYLRWFIRQFPLLEAYWELSFGILLLVVVLFFDNGVTGGLERLGEWLGAARGHYDRDGFGGVVGFGGESIVAKLRPVFNAVDSITGSSGPGSND